MIDHEYHRVVTARPQMAPHTVQALGVGWARYLMRRTGITGEALRDRYFGETGGTPEGSWHQFNKWAVKKVFIMDQLGRDPFPEEAA